MNRPPKYGLLVAAVLVLTGLMPAGIPASGAISPGDTTLVSVGDDSPDQVGAANSPAISGDGTQIAFESKAALDPAVHPTDGSPDNVFVRDRRSGRTVLVSRGLPTTSFSGGRSAPLRSSAGLEEGGNSDSLHPTLSASGRYVAFDSTATNLQDGYPLYYGVRVVLCDRDPDGDGTFDELRPDGTMDYGYVWIGHPPEEGSPWSATEPSLSADGSMITWLERSYREPYPDVVVAQVLQDGSGRPRRPDPESFLHPATERVPGRPRISADGRHVVFVTGSQAGPSGYPTDETIDPPLVGSIKVYDLPSRQTTQIDFVPGGGFSNQASLPAISGSGRMIAFEHRQQYYGPVVTVVVDRDPDGSGELGPAGERPVAASFASRDVYGTPKEGRAPALSSDGRYLAFQSWADDLHNGAQGTERTAIVLRDLTLDAAREEAELPRLPGELGSSSSHDNCENSVDACPAVGPSEAPALSANGSVVAFVSASDDLLANPCCAGAVFARAFHPHLEAAATDFGAVTVGRPVTRTIVVRHAGFGPLKISGTTLAGADPADFAFVGGENCRGATLNPTESCTLAIRFGPRTAGARRAVLRVTQSDGRSNEFGLLAEGTAVPGSPGNGLTVSADPVNFGGSGPALVKLGSRTIQVRNTSDLPIAIAAVGVLEGPRYTVGDFTVDQTTCGGVLQPGATCSIVLGATPQNGGARTGVLSITTEDPTYSRLVTLKSAAAQAALQVSPGVVRINRVMTVTGQNFPPNRAVTLTLTTPGTRLLLNTTTAADGRLTAALLAFPQTSTGTWPVIAAVGGTAVRAQVPVLVVPGSYQPPGFTSRR